MYTIKAQENDEAVVLHYEQDVEPIMDSCAALRREDSTLARKSDFRRTMQVPMIVIQAICDKHKLDFFNPEHAKVIMEKLKGPEFKVFRTVNDKVL